MNVSSERLTMRAIETADAALILACLRADDCGSPRAEITTTVRLNSNAVMAAPLEVQFAFERSRDAT